MSLGSGVTAPEGLEVTSRLPFLVHSEIFPESHFPEMPSEMKRNEKSVVTARCVCSCAGLKKNTKVPAFVGERLHLCPVRVKSLPAVVHIVRWGHQSVASVFKNLTEK